jgi:hypothetical protein
MKIIRFNETYKDVDPYGEEDWDERDIFLYAIVLWIGARTGKCEIRTTHVDKKIKSELIFFSIAGKLIHKTKIDNYLTTLEKYNFYAINNKIIIFDIDKINELTKKNISDKMIEFIKIRSEHCKQKIEKYESIIDNDGWDDEEEEYDISKLYDDIKKERTILSNLLGLRNNIRTEISNKIDKI